MTAEPLRHIRRLIDKSSLSGMRPSQYSCFFEGPTNRQPVLSPDGVSFDGVLFADGADFVEVRSVTVDLVADGRGKDFRLLKSRNVGGSD